jgi:DNA ligase-1
VLLARIAAASEAVAATSGRRAKIELLAGCLREADDAELGVVVSWLTGATRQRRTGLGWGSLRDLPPAIEQAGLTVAAVDDLLDAAARASGAGSQAARREVLVRLFGAATTSEQRFLAGLISGELRHGAQAGVLLEAVAAASAIPAEAIRRAVTLRGDLPAVAMAARVGGGAAVAGFGLELGRPLAPMLASTAPDLSSALSKTGPAAVEWKLDGVRIQVHRSGSDVAVFTRTLDEITDRVPEVVATARALPAERVVLDGETIALRPDGRPQPFQVSSSRVARRDPEAAATIPLTTMFFDTLHLDGQDLLDADGRQRRQALESAVPGELLVPRLLVEELDEDGNEGEGDDQPGDTEAAGFAADALARGHEGVVVKSLAVPYAMGRRGVGWIKVKPRLTLDLVVLAAEWGHGRRTGYLSNLHLGARDPDGEYGPPGGFVMLGKTFKGLTDVMLGWQTERLQHLAIRSERWQVDVRPELVVEIAFDGVQTSPRYPAGMALRFARVLAHRPDKPADQADTVATVRRLHAGATASGSAAEGGDRPP